MTGPRPWVQINLLWESVFPQGILLVGSRQLRGSQSRRQILGRRLDRLGGVIERRPPRSSVSRTPLEAPASPNPSAREPPRARSPVGIGDDRRSAMQGFSLSISNASEERFLASPRRVAWRLSMHLGNTIWEHEAVIAPPARIVGPL